MLLSPEDRKKYWLLMAIQSSDVLLPEKILRHNKFSDLFGGNYITAWTVYNDHYSLELTEKGTIFLINVSRKAIKYLCEDT